jgi:hypothetical protein
LSVVHISFSFVVSQALNAPADHKAQAISTGWKNRRIKRELSEFKAQKHLLVEVLRNIAWKHKTKNNASTQPNVTRSFSS